MHSQNYLHFLIVKCDGIWYYKRKYVRVGDAVKISYKRLWKLLIDKDMMKKELAAKAGISSASIAKLKRNENVNTDILLKICCALECNISDIMEIVQEEER